ncbi:glycoside hydrolase family 71/99-like protein [Roseomonas sp. BN140053]|uniref:glycoside hydrolase family 71/99-like protein n=1 Tax=Roseomonas sp. BN140053 TaxID=3391898 RepID=UPI0039E98CE9
MRNALLFLAVVAAILAGATAARAEGLDGTMIVGYQGWFACPGDEGPGGRGWVHWFDRGSGLGLRPTVDLLPDVSGMPEDALCDTPLKLPDGRTLRVFSSQRRGTVDTHFRWMAQHGIHGAALQRFATGLRPPFKAANDRVLSLVAEAAAAHGRSFFVTYDISGLAPDRVGDVVADWRALRASGVVDGPAWQRHRGRPVLGIFGVGSFNRATPDPAAGQALVDALRAAGPVTLMGGVQANWRTLDGNPRPDPAWGAVFRSFDIISPWSVGAFVDDAGADTFLRNRIVPDLAEARRLGRDYMPVIFPGFTWSNLSAARGRPSPANGIRRRCGAFYWHQARNAVGAGARMLFAAMFDEVDEGTAIIPVTNDVPRGGPATFVTRDADGCDPAPDWYLHLAGAVSRGLQAGQLPALPPP